jgi:hypothetical protein
MKEKEGEAQIRDMLKSLKFSEKHHFMMAIRGLAIASKWDDVVHFINMKKSPVTYSFLAEICIEHGKVPLAVEAIKKISDYDEKIPMLIDIGQWRDAIEEKASKANVLNILMISGKKDQPLLSKFFLSLKYLFRDFIKEEQVKRGK